MRLVDSGEVTVWTVGHSNRSKEYFVDLLRESSIKVLIDVRRFPTSKVEHFRKEKMEMWLPERGIRYVWLGEELGGYRRGGYEAYVKTEAFKAGVSKLLELARQNRTCLMCVEPDPQYCHRRFIAAYLKKLGVKVVHILKNGHVTS